MVRHERESYGCKGSRGLALDERRARIAQLNDNLRRHMSGGRVVVTAALEALGPDFLLQTVQGVRHFDAFDPDNDPHDEHDFGALTVRGRRLFWKIDYYDKALEYGSPDPASPEVTARVLTIMLASDY